MPGAALQHQALSWRMLSPFGVEIDHDLSRPLEGAARERFYDLFRQFGLIIARGQSLSMAHQTALMAPIGPFVLRPQENGYIAAEDDSKAGRSALSFHSDAAYTERPFAAISLHAVDVVDEASGTRFVSADAGRVLPPGLRARLETLDVEMISPGLEGIGSRASDTDSPTATHRAVFPAIRHNPQSGRPWIGIGEMHCAGFEGLDRAAGRSLMEDVFEHLYAPHNHLEHRWRRGDLVIWDNMAFQHARDSLAGVGRRVLQRVVAGS